MIVLIVSIVAGLAAALLSVNYLRTAARTVKVLVASKEIPAFTALTADQFTLRAVPMSAVPTDSMTDAAQVAGKYNRTLILAGSVMRNGYVAEATEQGGWLSAKLTETRIAGTRAFAIAVDNATAVGGTVEVGDKVDIVAAVKVDRTNGPAITFAKVIAAAAPVLFKSAPDGSAKATVVVQVTPAQAEAIAFAQTSGTISLATNPFRPDNAAQSTPGMTADRFLDRFGGR
jgi:Flp pilus assembly protein CpaB